MPITTFNGSASGGATESLTIGRFKWFNESSFPFLTPGDVSAELEYTTTFTRPSGVNGPGGAEDTVTFDLEITNTTGFINPDDEIEGLEINSPSDLTFNLSGLDVDSVSFSLEPGSAGAYNASSGVWTNPEEATSDLRLVAEFSAREEGVQQVPAPATFGLLGAALVGLGVLARWRHVHA